MDAPDRKLIGGPVDAARRALLLGIAGSAGLLRAQSAGRRTMEFNRIDAAGGLHAWTLPTGSFPLAEPAAGNLAETVRELLDAQTPEAGSAAAFLFPADLDHVETLMRANAGRWRLRPGYGIRPEAAPPTTPGVLDTMLSMIRRNAPKEMTLYRPADRVPTSDFITQTAGSGALIVTACAGPASACVQSFEEGLGPYLADPIAQGKGFYAPVLSRASLTHRNTPNALGQATLYIRECPEEEEVVIVSRSRIDSLP